jgi:hypothetical protein
MTEREARLQKDTSCQGWRAQNGLDGLGAAVAGAPAPVGRSAPGDRPNH